MGVVLRWFDELDVEFVRGVPALRPQDDGLGGESLFEPQPRGTALDRFAVQASGVFSAAPTEGGLFAMIGRRK